MTLPSDTTALGRSLWSWSRSMQPKAQVQERLRERMVTASFSHPPVSSNMARKCHSYNSMSFLVANLHWWFFPFETIHPPFIDDFPIKFSLFIDVFPIRNHTSIRGFRSGPPGLITTPSIQIWCDSSGEGMSKRGTELGWDGIGPYTFTLACLLLYITKIYEHVFKVRVWMIIIPLRGTYNNQ